MASSAKDLINKKKLIEDKQNKQVEIEVPDTGTFLFRIPNMNDYEDSQAYAKSRKNKLLENNYMLYSCCLEPNLKDEELLKEFEVKDPVDIIEKIFIMGEITSIADILVKKAGFDKEILGVSDKLKN